MSYLVLARKWRPQNFEEVVGQESITKTLVNSISSSRVPHAILFTGVRGVGKTTAARIFAKALNCEKGPTAKPCNECNNCKEITSGSSMDVLEIDGASNTGVNDIRELRETVRYLPCKSKYKVYIIDEVHMLSESAFNALLKTLEEPPANVIFMFATTEPESIPQTIISRCLRFDLKPIPLEKIFLRLKEISGEEKFEISDYSLKIIAREGKGSMRDALSILDKMVSYGGSKIADQEVVNILGLIKRDFLIKALDLVFSKDSKSLLKVVDDLYTEGYDPQIFLSGLLEEIRNMLVLKIDDSSKYLPVSEAESREILDIAKKVSLNEIEFVFDIIKNSLVEIVRTGHQRFILEMALVRASSVSSLVDIDSAIKSIKEYASGKEPVKIANNRTADKNNSDVNPKAEWQTVLKLVREKKPSLGAFLDNTEIDISANLLKVSFGKDSFKRDMISEPDNFNFLKEVVKERYGAEFELEIVKGSADPSNDSKEGAVKRALNVFGGKVEEGRS